MSWVRVYGPEESCNLGDSEHEWATTYVLEVGPKAVVVEITYGAIYDYGVPEVVECSHSFELERNGDGSVDWESDPASDDFYYGYPLDNRASTIEEAALWAKNLAMQDESWKLG